MSTTVGTIQYLVEVDTKSMKGQLTTLDNQIDDTTKKGASNFSRFASSSSDSFNMISDGLGRIIKAGAVVGTVLAGGMIAAAKASFDQVSAVQQATVALNAYEKDTSKVNKTLSELVAYARSDMGVLFNRKDLFAAAQGLKIMGDNTDQLTSHVQIMSRSVGLGLSNWADLTQIIGRVGSTGRLAGEDFDNLTKAGFKLDGSLRNTDITFEKLFKHLDKGIPADAMAGQANTIVGLGVRLETAFRGIGDAILGVDRDSGQFIKGGLGDKLVGLFSTITKLLKDPAMLTSLKQLGVAIGSFVEQALPKVIQAFNWIVQNQGTVGAAFAAIVAGFIAAKLAAIGFGIAFTIATGGINLLVLAVTTAIVALVGAITFLQLRFDIFGQAMAAIKPVVDAVVEAFMIFWNFIKPFRDYLAGQMVESFNLLKSAALSLWAQIEPFMPQIKMLGQVLLILAGVILGVFVGAIAAAIAILAVIVTAIARVIAAGAQFIAWISQLNGKIMSVFPNFYSIFYNLGGDIIRGLVNGVTNLLPGLLKTLKGIADSVTGIVKKVLGIHSPSTVFAGIGKNITQGLVQGITSGMGQVNAAVNGMSTGMISPVVSMSSPSNLENMAIGNSQAPVTVNLSMAGVMASSRSDLRTVAKDMIGAVNEELRAKGVTQIGGGEL